MNCEQVRQELATYRELGAHDKALVDAHLATCADCAATLARYQQQDRALAALPRIKPTARLAEVLAAASPRPAPRRWAYAVALASVLFLAGFGATAQVSADALPGEPLYAFKRALESMRHSVTWRDQARDELEREMAERRRAEAREVQQLRRSAELRFEGQVQAADAGVWLVEGLSLAVAPSVWQGDAPLGQMVQVRVQAQDGTLTALELRLQARGAYPGPEQPGGAYPAPTWTFQNPYPYPGPQAMPTPALPANTLPSYPYPEPQVTPTTTPVTSMPTGNPNPEPTARPSSATPTVKPPATATPTSGNPYPGPATGTPHTPKAHSLTATQSPPTKPAPTQPGPTNPAPTNPAPTSRLPTVPPTSPPPTSPPPTNPAPTSPAPTPTGGGGYPDPAPTPTSEGGDPYPGPKR